MIDDGFEEKGERAGEDGLIWASRFSYVEGTVVVVMVALLHCLPKPLAVVLVLYGRRGVVVGCRLRAFLPFVVLTFDFIPRRVWNVTDELPIFSLYLAIIISRLPKQSS